MSWYKYAGRGMSTNRPVPEKLADKVLLSCMHALDERRLHDPARQLPVGCPRANRAGQGAELMPIAMARWRCDDCQNVWRTGEILTVKVPHPKPGHDVIEIQQCPECGSCDNFWLLCDVEGCERLVTCGWPSPDGYRRTCHQHAG